MGGLPCRAMEKMPQRWLDEIASWIESGKDKTFSGHPRSRYHSAAPPLDLGGHQRGSSQVGARGAPHTFFPGDELVVIRPACQSYKSSSKVIPPVAKKVRYEMEMFGDVHVDDYYWLRDDSHSNPEILSYLKTEKDYTNQSLSTRTKKVDDISAPIRRGSYYYYERTLVGKDYNLHCRCLITNDASPPSVYDVMPTGPEASAEHVILDENIKAQGHEHYYLGAFLPSPNNKLIAYARDTKGDVIFTIYIIDADKGTAIGNPLKGVTSYIEWAGDDALVYITRDESGHPDKAWSHKLLSDQSSDLCLYHEKDDMFSLYIYASESKQ
ncbi:hypothetical protein KSP39_PZI014478 [Platanthera zijinensis]|uniref:Peptidase S9A N-terminal domain-containing protein n=1 Tax=Platanthera zijinensis TaxID=2320716 RepID=A0AAP0G2M0_9ASPA